MRKYSVLLIPDAEKGGYTVTVPSLPGCITEGDTLDEALTNVKDAISLYLEDVEASGESVPAEPTPLQLVTVEV